MKTLVLGLAVLTTAGVALAADPLSSASPPAPNAQTFAALDTNRDGQLSFSEAFAHPQLANAFNVLDSNADGVLSRAEVSQVLR